MISVDLMHKMWPHADQHVPGLAKGISDAVPVVFASETPLVIAHAMAQFSHECGAGGEMVENLNYSARGLCQTWPSRFGPDRAAAYAHNPQMIAETVYGGRMGNAPLPSHDGWTYRGRGLSQLTGRESYEKLGEKMGIDLAADPDLACEPETALSIGWADFLMCGCKPHAEKDDVVGVTRALNGGLIGLTERRHWLARWKAALGVS